MKWLIGSLVLLLIVLQYRLWFGDGSAQQFIALREEARETHAELLKLRGRNQALEAEVADLKSGLEAIEERARTELGMIDENETFYQFVKKRGSENSADVETDSQAAELDSDPTDVGQPLDADGSAAGRPLGPDGEQLPAPGTDDARRSN